MDRNEWNRARSSFNHDWLKNRLMVTLARARNVLHGRVDDDSIWTDLNSLLEEWTEKKADATRIVALYEELADPRKNIEAKVSSSFPPDVVDWLSDVAVQRWIEQESPAERKEQATQALHDVDHRVAEVSARLGKSSVLENEEMIEPVAQLIQAVSTLSGAMTDLNSETR